MARPAHTKEAVERLVGSSGRHDWSVEDVARALGGGVDFSTVWRAMRRLEEEGVLRRVEFGDGKARYEAARGHHEHVRCERCGTISAVEGCIVGGCEKRVEEATGFRVFGHELLFTGLCPRCSGEGA
ncbi:MAG: transcriptional repressor [Rubrobacteraceae bacterium]|uniref:Fur family transcriptional regulator n=1 Tax=Rubrobacter naiadicus TaxID=1392641 RepID=UPI00236033BA|nr:transcriptional repressor [Rubrobacter naiadicus]MBX6764259.1 transcriptional repressor [Rubrobacteraceae bacterium]MCL6438810.1 transcriptional repressor [Rubrobacteraceae bacterium]